VPAKAERQAFKDRVANAMDSRTKLDRHLRPSVPLADASCQYLRPSDQSHFLIAGAELLLQGQGKKAVSMCLPNGTLNLPTEL
jgi:hypothetical protein